MGAQVRHDWPEDVSDGRRVRRYRREIARASSRALRFQSREDLQRFWAECDAREGDTQTRDRGSAGPGLQILDQVVVPVYCLSA